MHSSHGHPANAGWRIPGSSFELAGGQAGSAAGADSLETADMAVRSVGLRKHHNVAGTEWRVAGVPSGVGGMRGSQSFPSARRAVRIGRYVHRYAAKALHHSAAEMTTAWR